MTSASLNLVVLYVSDLAESMRFYQLLDLDLTREQHDADGPLHYAAELPGGVILELYPAPTGVTSRVRLGLRLPDPAAAVERLRVAGFTVKRSDLAIDPDGNRVVITDRS
ncbi:VOC family protein [Mycobacteroides chelonae]|uniref:VOC family protein n=1 Tax=Mycobacteroides chelonae TaxID=1774 RepID=UPI0018E36767|nr:VOC family protein [Mycobacteroides chelonae]